MSNIKIAAYGRWSSRKTLQIASLIERFGSDSVVIVNADKGIGPVHSVAKNVVEANSLDDLRRAYGDVVKFIKDKPDAWLCLDGMTRVMNWIADEAIGGADEYAEQLALGTPHAGIETRLKPYRRFVTSDGGVDMMRIYGLIGTDSKNLLGAWLKLNCNLYSTYLEDQTSNGRDKGPPYVPDVPGQVGLKAVMSTYDFVIRLTIKNGKCVAQMDPTSALYLSRTREDQSVSGALPKEIDDFSLADFVCRIRGLNQ
jgi:hypothetical protein